ncbi:recombination factor protein RarA, partial [Pseudomonas syringae pv. tagetis]
RALTEERGLGRRKLTLSDEGFTILMAAADGDGRRMLNQLENASDLAEDGSEIEDELLQSQLGDSRRRFHNGREPIYH